MKHVLVTRMAIGTASEAVFRERTSFLLNGLYRSMVRQTCLDFEWVVVTEKFIDRASANAVKKAFRAFPHFHLMLVDSFVDRSISLPFNKIRDERVDPRSPVMMSRIDDDDMLSIDFVEQCQIVAKEHDSKIPAVLSFNKGYLVMPSAGRMAPTNSDHNSAGLTTISPAGHHLHPMSFGHNQIHDKLVELGGVSIIKGTRKPMWLVALHPGSDSRTFKSGSRIERALKVRESFTKDDAPEKTIRALRRFGLRTHNLDNIAVAAREDQRPDLVGLKRDEPKLKRLGIKQRLLEIADILDKTIPDGAGAQEQMTALREAYYAI